MLLLTPRVPKFSPIAKLAEKTGEANGDLCGQQAMSPAGSGSGIQEGKRRDVGLEIGLSVPGFIPSAQRAGLEGRWNLMWVVWSVCCQDTCVRISRV